MNPARLRAYLMLLAVAIIWGIAPPVIKHTLEAFPPQIFLAYRFGISTLVAIIIFSITGVHFPKDFKSILLLVIYGFINSVVALSFLFFGMENTSVLETGLITLASPLLISTAGVYLLHEHITKREKIGMAIAILGTALTVLSPLITNGHSELKLSGNLLVFGYVLSTIVTSVLGKNLLKKGINPMLMTNISFIIGFIFFGIFVLNQNTLIQVWSLISGTQPIYQLGVLYMAIISGTIAFYLNTRAQKTIEIGEASVFTYLDPLFSLPLAIFWLGEKVTPIYIIGGIIIIIGVAVAELKKKRYNSTSKGK